MSRNGQEPLNERNIPLATRDTAPGLCGDLKALLDGELAPPRRWMVQWHKTRCGFCQEEERWLHRLGEDMKDLEKARPRPELRRRILNSLPDTPPVGMPGRSRIQNASRTESDRRSRFPYLVAAAFVVTPLLLIGVFLLARTLSLRNQDALANQAAENSRSRNHFADASPARPESGNTDPDIKRILTPLPPPPLPEDPLSKEADRLVARQESGGPDARTAPAHDPTKPAEASGMAPTAVKKVVHLTLVAADIGIAHDRLQALTADVGGTVTNLRLLHPHAEDKDATTAAVKSTDPGVPVATPDHTSKPTPAAKDNEPFVLIAEVPVERATEFRRSMASYGSVTLTKIPRIATATHSPTAPPPVVHPSIAPPVFITNEDGSPALAAASAPLSPAPARATVRFVIRVQAS